MQTGRITARIFASIAARVAMAVLFVFCNAFFVRARDSRANEIERVRVHFPFDNAELRSNYMNNESSLISLRQLLEATDGNIDVEVIAYSSPEGNESYNKSLSARRAASVKNFVLSLFPDSKPTVKVISVSEAWDQFRAYVAADKSLDAASRSELLLVIDSDSKADEKESLVKSDPNYKRLYSKYFRSLRYAEISLKLSSAAVFGLVNTNASVPGMGVSFANGSSKLDLTNKETVDALNAMVAFFRENPSAADDYVIAGAASPEGPTSANNRLALMRAKAVADYISEKAPELKGKLHIKAAGEDWNGLRNAILAEDSLSSTDKQQLCAIIDSNASADEKEAALKNHPAYQTVRDNCFGALRRQSIVPADSATSSSTAAASATAEGKDTASSSDKGVAGMGVSFRNGSSKLDPNYKDNRKALDEMVAFFRENPSAADEYDIVGAASPDGPTSVNDRLARERAQAVADYISEQAPELKDRLHTRSAGEDWNGLRKAVLAEDSLSDKDKKELCEIIDSNASADEKEKALKNHPAYETVREKCFDPLRSQSIGLAEDRNETTEAPAELEEVVEKNDTTTTTQIVNKDTLSRIERLPGIYTKAVKQGEDSVAEYIPVEEPQYDTIINKVPVVAATYNFLPNLATVGTGFHVVPIQAGIDVPVGDHWSIYADYLGTAPWRAWDNNAECAELLHWTLGTRWYPGSKFATPFNPGGTERILEGWYASLSVGAGYYDFEHNGKGYQGEEILASLGLGYSLVFNENWSMNFGIGFGPMFTQWRYYIEKTSNQHLIYQYSGKSQYFGVTDAKITLTYLFHANKKKEVRK